MFKKILYGMVLVKLTAVLGAFIGVWALALPIGLIVSRALYVSGNVLGEEKALEQKREDLSDINDYDLSDTDAYIITGEWGYGSGC